MIAIMQPTFLPWVGYFDLIDQVKIFIFLDNVQFSKQSWQQRNRISTERGLEWITVPVFKGGMSKSISDIKISCDLIKILNKIEANYKKYPYFELCWPQINQPLKKANATDSLSKLNIDLIESISKILGIETTFYKSSQMNISEDRVSRLVDIIKLNHSGTYLSPVGALEYISSDFNSFTEEDIEVRFQNYIHPNYSLVGYPFSRGASIIDLIFMHGPNSIEFIRSGRGRPHKIEELLRNE